MKYKKLVIVLVCIAISLFVFTSTAVTALALTNQSSSTPIQFTYSAKNIGVEVQCTKFFAEQQEYFQNCEQGKFVFKQEKMSSSFDLEPTTTQLNSSTPYVVYELIFNNLSSSSNYMISISYDGEDADNLMFYTNANGTEITDPYNNMSGAVKMTATMFVPFVTIMKEEQNHYIYLMIKKKDEVSSASVLGKLKCAVVNEKSINY